MKDLKKEIAKFEEKTGIFLKVKDNKPYYGGNLDLRGTGITSLPDNLTVGGDLDLRGTGITSLPDNLTVGGYLDLEGCTGITSLPDNLTVGGSLDLRGTGITSLPDNLTVGGYLDLEGCTGITSLPDNLTVGGSLDLRSTGITSLPDNLTVGDNLYLYGCTGITSLPDNLTVGGSLDLRSTGITSLPDNLTVGDNLYLYGCTGITSLPDNLTVGGSLYLYGCTGITNTSKVNKKLSPEVICRIEANRNQVLRWEWAGRTYIKVDNIFSQVISKHGNVLRIRQVGKNKNWYLVTDGNGKWAHGDTIDEARKDLIYKISNRDKSVYESLTLDSELTFEECIECYRVITGACSSGTRNYVENRLPKPHKDKYTIREMIELTEGEYNSDKLKEFFMK